VRLFADVLSALAMALGPKDREKEAQPTVILHYRLEGNRDNAEEISSWGHEYVKALAGELGTEFRRRTQDNTVTDDAAVADLLALMRCIIPFQVSHNAEVDATDLCLETGRLRLLLDPSFVPLSEPLHKENAVRICSYLLKCVDYLGDSDECALALDVAFELYLRHGCFSDALVTALRMNALAAAGGTGDASAMEATSFARLQRVFDSVSGFAGMDGATASATRKQLGFLLGRHRLFGFTYTGAAMANAMSDDSKEAAEPDTAEVNACIGNARLASAFAGLVKDLDTAEPKAPEDIYKSHLAGSGTKRGGLRGLAAELEGVADSAKGNLASAYVNAFVNAGYGTDKLMTPADSSWVYKQKGDLGQMAAVASLGLIHAWKEEEMSSFDKYLQAEQEGIKAGAILAISLCCTGTRNLDVDPVFALLMEHVEESSTSKPLMKLAAVLGLGLAYAGSNRNDVVELLVPHVMNDTMWEKACVAALAIGLIRVGSGEEASAAIIADRLLEATETALNQPITRQMMLGLGLLFLGRGEAADVTQEILQTITHPSGKVASVLLRSCAYAGTGDVLQVQTLLRLCAEHPEAVDKEREEEEAQRQRDTGVPAAAAAATGGAGAAEARTNRNLFSTPEAPGSASASAGSGADAGSSSANGNKYMYQTVASLGLSLVSLGEELSVDMATRMADHLLQYGDTAVRKAVPLSLALLHVSDPDYAIIDVLSKLSHDPHVEVAQAAIFAMGLAGAGTNNSRVAGLFRTLAEYYAADTDTLFVIRIAQGVLHMGKGLLTLSPLHWGRQVLSPVTLAALLPALLLFLEPQPTLSGRTPHHYLLFSLAAAMNPRFATTFLQKADGSDEPIAVEVRVGQAVETVGQAGKPKTITGFQTHTTPVLISAKDRAELADEAYVALTSVVEGMTMLVPNPDSKVAKKKAAAAAGASAAGSK
jgi:26S proteasome regulatory subunit N1